MPRLYDEKCGGGVVMCLYHWIHSLCHSCRCTGIEPKEGGNLLATPKQGSHDDFDGNSCLYRARICLTAYPGSSQSEYRIHYQLLISLHRGGAEGADQRKITCRYLQLVLCMCCCGEKPSRIFCPSPYWYWTVPISKFPKLPCVAKLETKLMIILPRIKADYDNYIHFNHIKQKIEACYIYVHSILHVFTKI